MSRYTVTTTTDQPLVIGERITGTSVGRTASGKVAFRSTWSGVYVGTQDPDPADPFLNEDGTPAGGEETIHLFRDGDINGLAQSTHGFPVSNLAG